jgi:hypothetical protein
MPKFLEDKLKKEYGADSAVPYKTMNKLGYMHGNKETPAGKAAEMKHEKKMKKKKGKEKAKSPMTYDEADKAALRRLQGA